jgi:broad specificity phosphatase PhoE
MADVWFIRHGESTWNAEGRWQGQADPPLSERGRRHAEDAAARLAGAGIARIAASDLARARHTAEILAARLGLAVELDAGLRELDVGRWSGLAPAEIERRWPDELARFRAGDLALRPGGGESRLALRERVGLALARLAARADGAAVAVVSHLGVLRALQPGAQLAPGAWLRLGALAEPARAGHTRTAERAEL